MKHPMIDLVWDPIWNEGELRIHANFFSIDGTSQIDMINDWITDLTALHKQIRIDQPITEPALPRLERLFFGHRERI